MKPSQPCDVGQAGFTLLEVMIVLGLMAFAVTLLGPILHRGTSPHDLDRLGERLVAELRIARDRSARRNVETALAFDPALRSFLVLPGRDRIALPRDVAADLTTGRQVDDGTRATIRFLPDGRSSGGDIRLASGSFRLRITVDWLTGWPRLDPAAS